MSCTCTYIPSRYMCTHIIYIICITVKSKICNLQVIYCYKLMYNNFKNISFHNFVLQTTDTCYSLLSSFFSCFKSSMFDDVIQISAAPVTNAEKNPATNAHFEIVLDEILF